MSNPQSMTEILKKQYPHLFESDANPDESIVEADNLNSTAKEQSETTPKKIETLVFEDDSPTENSDIDTSTFDLNFAEFPIAHLSKRIPAGMSKTEIQYSDWITGFDGKKVERKWTISSYAKDKNGNMIGIGGPTSLNVFYEIMQIWKEQGNKGDKIYVGSYFSLLKRLDWQTGGAAYKQLDNDLKSIYGLEIEAKNAYYDKEKRKYVDWNFKPFIGWMLFKENEIKDYMTDYGYIQVHPDFAESFRKKTLYFLPFDNLYFHKLNPHEKKLAFYLTKIFNPYRKKVQYKYSRNIFELCDQLPIYGESRKRKYYLLTAAKGLIKKDFVLLEKFEIKDDIIILYNRQQSSLLPFLKSKIGIKPQKTIDLIVEEILKICGDNHSIKFYSLVAKFVPDEIIYRALSEAKQEGNPPKKLFTSIIIKNAAEYISKFIKTEDKNNEINAKNKNKPEYCELTLEEQIEINDYGLYEHIIFNIKTNSQTEEELKEKDRLELKYGDDIKAYGKRLMDQAQLENINSEKEFKKESELYWYGELLWKDKTATATQEDLLAMKRIETEYESETKQAKIDFENELKKTERAFL